MFCFPVVVFQSQFSLDVFSGLKFFSSLISNFLWMKFDPRASYSLKGGLVETRFKSLSTTKQKPTNTFVLEKSSSR